MTAPLFPDYEVTGQYDDTHKVSPEAFGVPTYPGSSAEAWSHAGTWTDRRVAAASRRGDRDVLVRIYRADA